MSRPVYSCPTPSVALSAATAKTVLGVKGHANSGLILQHVRFGFDGVTASATPVLVELCYCTWASNSPGTNSTSITILQDCGRILTAGFTAGHTWTTEPTVLSVLDSDWFRPDAGSVIYDFPLQTEYDCAFGEGFALRFTAPAIVNARAKMRVSRI